MYELYDFLHTSKLVMALLIIAGVLLLLAFGWYFIIEQGMSVLECKSLWLMAILFVLVVIGAVS